jgi:small subunit ribosomal protein S20
VANIKASKKDILVNARNKKRNQHFRSKIKTLIKKAQIAISAKSEESEKLVREALRVIDKTVTKGVIKKQTAARKKSRLALALNKAQQA